MNKAAQSAVAEAAAWCQHPFVVFDTETTGFGTDDEIIQIAIADQDGKTLLNTYIKPSSPILNVEYHGITNEMVQGAPTFPDVYPQIIEAMAGKRLAAYNLAYDRRMLHQVVKRHKLTGLTRPTGLLCVMELYAPVFGEWNDYRGNYKWQKLDTAAKALKVARDGAAHDALSDVRVTLDVLRAMASLHEAQS